MKCKSCGNPDGMLGTGETGECNCFACMMMLIAQKLIAKGLLHV